MAVATESSGSDQGGGGKGEKGPRVSMGSGVRMMSRKSSCPGDVHRPGVPPGEQCLLASVSLLLSRALHALHPFMQWSCPACMPHPKLRVLQFVQGPSSLLCIVSSVHQATADKNKTQIVTFPWLMQHHSCLCVSFSGCHGFNCQALRRWWVPHSACSHYYIECIMRMQSSGSQIFRHLGPIW